MNGNPEGTPNPLNPNPGAGASATPASFSQASVPQPIMPVAPVGPTTSAMPQIATAPARPVSNSRAVVDPMMRPANHARTTGMNASATTTMASEPAQNGMSADSFVAGDEMEVATAGFAAAEGRTITPEKQTPELVPEEQPVAKDSIVEPAGGKKSKKKGLITVAVILIVAALGCGIAALVIALTGGGNDKVAAAINKVLNGEVSSIVKMDGTVTVTGEDDVAMDIKLTRTEDTATNASKTEAKITTERADGTDYALDVDSLVTKDGATYLKLGNLANAFAEVETVRAMQTVNLGEETLDAEMLDETGMNMLEVMRGILQTIDRQWILIPETSDGEGLMENLDGLGLANNTSICLINAFGTVAQYGDDITKNYRANEFVTYSTDNLGIAQKKNTLYRLGFNEEKLTAFINGLAGTGFMNSLNACAGKTATSGRATVTQVEEIFADFPTVYVEIDENNNFTRVYFAAELADGSASVTADLALSYPAKMEITEPTEYLDLNTLMAEIMMGLFGGEDLPILDI